MAENPTVSPPKPQQQQISNGAGDPNGTPSSSTPQNPNANLPSTPIQQSPSPSHSQISSSPRLPPLPQTPQAANQINHMSQIQSQQQQFQQLQQFQQQQGLMQQRPGGSVSRISQIQQKFGAAVAANALRQHGGIYGGQMNFGSPTNIEQQHQMQQQMTRVGMIGQGAGGQLAAVSPFTPRNQMLGQVRQSSGSIQSPEFHPTNVAGQTLQGMQTAGMTGALGLNSQIRDNGSLSYSTQRINQGQLRQKQSSQSQIPSNQTPNQGIARTSSLASLNSQFSGLNQNGQATMLPNSLSQQQWLKQNQLAMNSLGSSYQQLQQKQMQRAFLQQQLQKSMPMNQQISQLIQHQPQLGNQQQQQFQNQSTPLVQQQQTPRMTVPANQRSMSLPGSQPDTPGGSSACSSQRLDVDKGILGKRKIQDLVAQVDPQAKLDPELEDLLLEISDEFINSVTAVACSFAKHRKSPVLEPKDILLHLEKNIHLKVPGYEKEEQGQRKLHLDDGLHKTRIDMIRSLMETSQSEIDTNNAKGTARQFTHNSSVDHAIRSSPSSEQLISTSTGSPMLQKVPRF